MNILDQLRAAIGGAFVLTTVADTAKWAQDWTGAYTSTPIAVLRPKDTAEVAAIMGIAHATKTPVVPVSGNTGVTGGACAKDALLLSLDRLDQIAQIDAQGRTATVGAGVILADLHKAVETHGLIFPLTLGARGSAMIGGVLATNAGGSNVLRYGNTRDLVMGIEVVMADGAIMNLMGALHKDNSGLNLKHLMIGAEGTLGIITAAVLKLSPAPGAYATAMVATPDLNCALTLLHRAQTATGDAVEAFEFMPRAHIDGHLALDPQAKPPFENSYDINILIEVGATAPRDATPNPDGSVPVVRLLEDILAQMFEAGLVLDAVVAQNATQRAAMWARREAAAQIAFAKHPFIDTDIAVALPDVAVFLDRMTLRLADLDAAATDLSVVHLGDGNIHYTAYPSRDDPALTQAIKRAVEDVVHDLNGSFSAEHGVGLSKLTTMRRCKDPVALASMKAIKAALDPDGILNPGKMYPD
uniref:FAD-binding oxidoreductase n=3 Tax=Yoonia sp. TaxID=2212373 RepID=UPI00404842F3|tara:strand:- start:154 stop:1566 length:1413 start_codon:yes stop_codon:yes gene_type:complete